MGRGKRGRKRAVLGVVALAVALAGFTQLASPAQADTRVYAIPGQVGVVGDGADNDIDVWASPVDTNTHTWIAQDSAVVATLTAFYQNLAESFVDAQTALRVVLASAEEIESVAHAAQHALNDPEILARLPADRILDLRKLAEGRLAQIQRGRAVLQSTKFLVELGSVAALALAIGSMFSDDKILIRAREGNLAPLWPCHGDVREAGGLHFANTVACPAPYILSPLIYPGFVNGLVVDGGGGADTLKVNFGREHFPLSLGDEIPRPVSAVFVMGGNDNDRILGSEGEDNLLGGAGRDTIVAKGGDDYLYGFGYSDPEGEDAVGDDDALYGGAGSDVIEGQAGNDLVFGGRDDDWAWIGYALTGGPGNDVVVGGPGRDEQGGGPGRDTILARESDRPLDPDDPGGPRAPDEVDYVIDCGPEDGGADPGSEYYRAIGLEDITGCEQPLINAVPAGQTVINDQWPSPSGDWPWFR